MKAEINNETPVFPPTKEMISLETLQACAASRAAREWEGTDPHTTCNKCKFWYQVFGAVGACQSTSVFAECGDYPRVFAKSPGCKYWEQLL